MSNLVFATKKEAVEFLRGMDTLAEMSNGNFYPAGTYYLSHGEYSQPEYKVVRYKDGWGIKKIHFYYPNTFNAPKDGRCIAVKGLSGYGYDDDEVTLVLQDYYC